MIQTAAAVADSNVADVHVAAVTIAAGVCVFITFNMHKQSQHSEYDSSWGSTLL